MSEHRIDVVIDAEPEHAVSLLASRPAGWLRGFLRLAVIGPAAPPPPGTAPWFRLGAPSTHPSGSTVCPFVWWPHVEDPDVFERFCGHLLFGAVDDGTRLRLIGRTDGGAPAVSDSVLTRLLTVLGGALRGAQGVA